MCLVTSRFRLEVRLSHAHALLSTCRRPSQRARQGSCARLVPHTKRVRRYRIRVMLRFCSPPADLSTPGRSLIGTRQRCRPQRLWGRHHRSREGAPSCQVWCDEVCGPRGTNNVFDFLTWTRRPFVDFYFNEMLTQNGECRYRRGLRRARGRGGVIVGRDVRRVRQ